jgi:hypothetical protein
MADRNEPRDTRTSDIPERESNDLPNRASNQEKAEGSRENTNVESGITNRPIAEEQEEQQNLPPRGSGKGGTHA